MIGSAPICVYCQHYQGARFCEAFQGLVPDAIWGNDFDHRDPFPGDNGMQFEDRPDKPLPEWNDPFNPLMVG